MTVRDIRSHLEEIYGVDVSPDVISRVTDAVWDELDEWRNRPLDEVYPTLYVDALNIKIRDGIVSNRPAYLARRRRFGGQETRPGDLDRRLRRGTLQVLAQCSH